MASGTRSGIRAHSALAISLCLAAGLALLVASASQASVLGAWVAGINAVSGCTFAYDKGIAGSGRTRIPERTLLALCLAGGSPAALLSMRLLRHKTAKTSFQRRFWLVVAAQVALATVYLAVRQQWLAPIVG